MNDDIAASPSMCEESAATHLTKYSLVASKEKLQQVADSLKPWLCSCTATRKEFFDIESSPSVITCRPCQSLSDAIHYRCKCSFQIIATTSTTHTAVGSNGSSETSSLPVLFAYAIRQNSKPVMISDFPPANRRISQAMRQLLQWMNDSCDGNEGDEDDRCVITDNLTSVTFASSWDETDCLLALHYCQPMDDNDVTSWQRHAAGLCKRLTLLQVTGHSKKLVLKAYDNTEIFIHDTIWLTKKLSQDEKETNAAKLTWSVHVSQPPNDAKDAIAVHYEKPATAFFHPSAPIMCSALTWMLDRVSSIAAHHHQQQQKRHEKDIKRPRLLELYCGCGAHTMALAKSGLLQDIVAVEVDERLVQAAVTKNMILNQAQSVVTIDSSSAGQWARRFMKKPLASEHDFDILLVDPPRQGLDEDVCCMARAGPFEHLLYISCGRDALVQDLERLASDFFVVDCTLLDLFPGTYSVESLVHLRRRSF